MLLLDKTHYQKIYTYYLENKDFYPLIGAILLKEQDGLVYVNCLDNPSQIYVEHSFGFAQLFGQKDEHFEQQLEAYLFLNKSFSPEKIRLYAPNAPTFILKPKYETFRSYRQRFKLELKPSTEVTTTTKLPDEKICFSGIADTNCEALDDKFHIVSRFWRNSVDFIKHSNAFVVYYNKEPASMCYAAANANCFAEIDVLTLPQYRNLGLGRIAVLGFIKRCIELSIVPLWDCFTNNEGSMSLCKSVGFIAPKGPYLFFTISKTA